MLQEFLTASAYSTFLIFCRIGTAFMLLPGIGEAFIMARARLLVALAFSVMLAPLYAHLIPAVPGSPLLTTVHIISEVLIGALIGGLSRIMIGAMHTAGIIIASQSSLASAMMFDINQETQGAVIGNFMSVLGVTLLFATDMHHLMFKGIADSYSLFPPGTFPPVQDFANLATQMVGRAFTIALQISAPVIVVTMLLYLAAGVMARLMPSMQVFFVLVPVQIVISFFILAVTLSGSMLWYLRFYSDTLGGFIAP